MERRRFLGAAAVGLAATGLELFAPWPRFLARAFGDEGSGSAAARRARSAELAAAITRARSCGKPLLVLVVPTEEGLVYERGRILGELINHGGPGVLDDLLVCELACATLEEAKRALPLDVKGAAAMLLVELDSDGGEFLPVQRVELPTSPSSTRGDPEAEAAIRLRIAAGAVALHAAVHPTADCPARRAERNAAALGEADRAAIAEGVAGRGAIDPDLARRGAALLVVAAAESAAEPSRRARAALDAGHTAIVRQPPAGAQWANTAGCGVQIEGEPLVGVKCGMGAVPALSQRFLHFYTTP